MDQPPPDGARKALIDAALRLFGEQGFAATSTRQITAAAGVNLALITYHFGGKEGLRLACGEEVARRMRLAAGAPASASTPSEAMERLETVVRGIVAFLCRDEAAPMVAFIAAEVMRGGPVLDAVHDAFIGPKHAELSALWALATGRAPDETLRLQVFTLIGQVAYFRIGARVVSRVMGWPRIGPSEAERITNVILANLHALAQVRP